MSPTNERRREPRYTVTVDVTLDSEHNFFTGLTQDMSGSGLFVATNCLCPIGERVSLRMRLPTSKEPIDAITEVRWVRTRDVPGGGGKAGLGLKFVQMSPQGREAVKAFLAKRESIFFDAD